MSNVSIYEKNWTDLVFEDKNKAYGAYQLRQENPRTTLIAFFSGILFIFSIIGLWLLFSSFDKKPDEIIISCPIGPKITPVDLDPKTEPLKPKVETTQSSSVNKPNKFQKLVVAETQKDNVDVPKNTDIIPETTPTTGQGTATGTGINTPSDGGNSTVTISIPLTDNSPKGIGELDRLPEYPGGIAKFYNYVGNTIEKPDADYSSSSMSVTMSFVIEKDGTMTDIKVLRSSDKNLEKEAIRVLKALKTKWSPGFKNGEKVRTLYLLPIKVTL